MALVRLLSEAIERDQAKGLDRPMEAQEMSVALNRFNLTYLSDRFGSPRRKGKPTDKETTIEVLPRVWTATLCGKITVPRRKRLTNYENEGSKLFSSLFRPNGSENEVELWISAQGVSTGVHGVCAAHHGRSLFANGTAWWAARARREGLSA